MIGPNYLFFFQTLPEIHIFDRVDTIWQMQQSFLEK